MKTKTIPGINIQWPWSGLLLNKKKTIETRKYPISSKYLGRELAIIETPGPLGRMEAGIKKARIIGTITFESCYQYNDKNHWASERDKHLVQENNKHFYWTEKKKTWAWQVKSVTVFTKPLPPPKKRGIIYAKFCKI